MGSLKEPVSRMLWVFLIAAVLLAGGFPQPARAQTPSLRFDTLSVEDGLSHSIVHTIMQDSRGYLWFGTEDGLNRYDGYSFTSFHHDTESPTSISDSKITTIYQDSHGEMWIGTGSGLDRLVSAQGTFQHFLPDSKVPGNLSGPGVTAIVEDRLGGLWIGTSNNGLNLFDRETGTFTHYTSSPSQPNSLINDQVTALAGDQRGGIWIGTNGGLDYFDPRAQTHLHYTHNESDAQSLSSNSVTTLFQDRFGILWIGTEDNGLNSYNPATRLFTRFLADPDNPNSVTSQQIRAIFEDQNGRLWIGGRNGIDLYNRANDQFQHYKRTPGDSFSLGNDYVLSIFADRTGILWFGTYGGGISKYVPSNDRFTLFQSQPGTALGLSNDIVSAICEDHAGIVWVGTLDGGIKRLIPESDKLSSLTRDPADPTSLGSNDVRAIIEDHTNTIWVGTFGGGLNRFDPRTGHFTRFLHNSTDPDSLSDSQVTILLEDSAGNLWVGTRNGGLNLFDQATSRFSHYRYSSNDPASLSSDSIQTMYEDREGKLWIGTYEGISVLDPTTQTFTRYQNDSEDPTSLSHNRVMSFYEAPDGTMWVGTLLGGLNRFDPSSRTFKYYTVENGLPNNTIYGILADTAGYLWLSTNWGLSRFDPQTETFRNYDRRDGLQSNEFSPGAYFQNAQGWMYFGGVQGINVFDPSRVLDNPVAPPVVITAFKKFNQNQPFDPASEAPLRLSYEENFISFEFAALDFTAPEKNRYAYKLEGFDKDWVDAGTRRYASYTNLRGGTYVFHVIGSNPDGVWNETGAIIVIEVSPPIWERWWFITSAALLLIGGAFGGYRLRVVGIEKQNRSLEKQVGERTQEIERRREVAEGLRDILSLINSNRTLKESLDAIILQINRLMETRGAVIFNCGDDSFPIILASNLPDLSTASPGRGVPSLPDWITTPVNQGETLKLTDLGEYAQSHPEVSRSIFSSYRTLLAVPLVVNDRVDGGLVLLYHNLRELSDDDKQIAASFANHAALAIANADLRSQAEEIAVSAERSRLARDLHDAVTQTLFATSLIAEVLPRLWERNPEAGKQKVTEIRELTRGALAEMRTLLMELRPKALEDVPLPDLLQQLSEAFTGRARIPVERAVSSAIELPSQVKIGFYRIVQEALNNIQKHARASFVRLELQEENGLVKLRISDNGIGFNPARSSPDHFGLGIMEERAQNIQARLFIDSEPGKGTQIVLLWNRYE